MVWNDSADTLKNKEDGYSQQERTHTKSCKNSCVNSIVPTLCWLVIVWRCDNVQMLLDEQDVQVTRKYNLNFRVAAALSRCHLLGLSRDKSARLDFSRSSVLHIFYEE